MNGSRSGYFCLRLIISVTYGMDLKYLKVSMIYNFFGTLYLNILIDLV